MFQWLQDLFINTFLTKAEQDEIQHKAENEAQREIHQEYLRKAAEFKKQFESLDRGAADRNLPRFDEINPHAGCRDEQHAVKSFLGKNHDEARALFEDSFEFYQEDLMFMGTEAFLYYLPDGIAGAESTENQDDDLVCHMMLSIFQVRMEYESDELQSVVPVICDYLDRVLERVLDEKLKWELSSDLRAMIEQFSSTHGSKSPGANSKEK